MRKTTIRRMFCIAFLVLLTTIQVPSLLAVSTIDIGEAFPDVPLPAPPDPVQRAYLGLADDQPFTLSQVAGRIVLVEMLNVLCPHCRKQTRPYNQLYRMIEADPETRGRIKMLGVAVANDDEAIEDFVDIYGVAFPVVSDRQFKLHSALRAGPTPFTLYVLRDRSGEAGVVADTHLGTDYKMEELFAFLKDLLSKSAGEFAALPRDAEAVTEELKPPQSEAEIVRMVQGSFATQGENLNGFRKLDLPSGRWLYAATLTRDGLRQPVFAEVASRSAICDICHSVHFFYVFDGAGRILAFVPLHLTKYGNVEWNQAEIDHFASRVVGKPLAGTWNFDPRLDAVTSATMTSAIIFNNLDQGRELLEELRRQNLLEP